MQAVSRRRDLWTLGASAAVACGVLTSCGAEDEMRSARFVQKTVYYSPDEGPLVENLEGRFDWERRRGHATETALGQVTQTIQIGDKCYKRFNGEWEVSDADDVDRLCDAALFSDPRDELSLLQSVASNFRSVGRERVRGTDTTLYRGRLNIGGVQGSIEVWVDEDGVVRKSRQTDGDAADGFETVREYVDFGIDVDVSPPPPFGENG
jgi:hypothetical protein